MRTTFLQNISTRRPRFVVLLAIVILIFLGWYGFGLFGHLADSSEMTLPGSESYEMYAVVKEEFGVSSNSQIILFERKDDSLGDANSEFYQSEVAALLEPLKDKASSMHTYQTTGSESFMSHDRSSTFATITLKDEGGDAYQVLRDFADNADQSKLRISIGGNDALNAEMGVAVSSELLMVELISLPILLILLLIFFRSPVAALIPIGIAIFTVIGGLAVTRLFANFVTVDAYAVNIITILGIGLSIDYALLSVNRFREELPRGVDNAVKKVITTSGHTVLFSGITVIACLTALFVFPIELIQSIAVGGAAAIAVAIATSYLVLPSVLKLLGANINKGRRRETALLGVYSAKTNFWGRLATVTTSRPITSLTVALAVIALAFIPLSQFQAAGMTHKWLSRTIESGKVTTKLAQDFDSSTADVAVVANVSSSVAYEDKLAIACQLTAQLQGQAHVSSVQSAATLSGDITCDNLRQQYAAGMIPNELQPLLDRYISSGAVAFDVYITDVDSRTKDETMLAIRDIEIDNVELLVGGPVAEVYDMNKSYFDNAPLAVLIIIVSMIALLALALRSIVVPILAVVTNTLGLAISLGLIVGVFQLGWFSNLTGWPQVDGIALTAPVIFIAISFGLAMDYSVFLFSRMREVYDQTGDIKQAVWTSIAKTGPIITAAALAFFVVVAGLAFSSTLMMQIIGIGLAVAVIVDAFFVRLLLVPSLMVLLGRFAWR